MKFYYIILALLFPSFLLESQVQQEWVARYNGQNTNVGDWAYGIDIDNNNNIYVTGVMSASTLHDIGTLKYNSNGELLWARYYDGTSNVQDFGYDIAVDRYQSVYVTGKSYDTAQRNFVLIKYDSSGTFKWDRRHIGDGVLIKVDKNGNIIAVGNDAIGIVIVKYTSDGFLVWQKRFEALNSYSNFSNNLYLDDFNNIYIGGISSFNNTYDDLLIFKMNYSGDLVWYRTFNGTSNDDDYLYKLGLYNNDNIYVCGQVFNSNTFNDYITIKYDSSGNLIWYKTFSFDSLYKDYAFTLSIDNDENLFVSGRSYLQNGPVKNNVIKYDRDGNIHWNKDLNFEDGYYLYPTSSICDSYGDLYIAGLISNYDIADYLTIKIRKNGVISFIERYNGPGNGYDAINDMIIDFNQNIIVTGASVGTNTLQDYCTIKYTQPIGIQQISLEVPDKFMLYQNYPNPFNPETKIKFEIPNSKFETNPKTEIRIYDILGREIKTLVNEQLKPGIYEVEFDGTDLPSGVYFYKLITISYTQTKKMILIK